jgi:hypothetical protein
MSAQERSKVFLALWTVVKIDPSVWGAPAYNRRNESKFRMLMLQDQGPVMAMSTEHRSVLADVSVVGTSLYSQRHVAFQPLPDVDEVVKDPEANRVAVYAHVRMIIDRIIE